MANPIAPVYHPRLVEMWSHVNHIESYVSETERPGIESVNGEDFSVYYTDLNFAPLQLSECGCDNYSRLTKSYRNDIEKRLVERLLKRQSVTEQVRLLSLGSGGLMTDFITIEKLILAGFRKISIDCVDIAGIKPEALQRIREFFAGFLPVSVTIEGYSSIESLPKNENGYTAALAVDFGELTHPDEKKSSQARSDYLKAEGLIGSKGFFLVGDPLAGWCKDKEGKIDLLFVANPTRFYEGITFSFL